MKKNVYADYQTHSERVNGKNISFTDVQLIHDSLIKQSEEVAEQIVESIDQNDYVTLSLLITKRKKVQAALDEINSLYGEELTSSPSFRNQLSIRVKKSAQLTDEKGEELLLYLKDSAEKLNESVHSIGKNTLDSTARMFNIGNQLSHKLGRCLVDQTSTGLSKLADLLKK